MGRWAKWLALPPRDRRLIARAALQLAVAKAALPWIRLQADANGAPDRPADGCDVEVERGQAVARLVAMASSGLPFATTCLHRALVLQRLLARERIPARLRIGARTSPGPFEAHAWVECHGSPLNEEAEHVGSYQPFDAALSPAVPGEAHRRAPTAR